MALFQKILLSLNSRLLNRLLSFLLIAVIFLIANNSYSQTANTSTKAPISVFSNSDFKYLYRAHITIDTNQLSGLLIIKKVADSSYRIAFVTEVGLKIFEMEFLTNKKKSFIKHSCLSYLDRKPIINTLRRDFESIFMNFAAWKTPKIKTTENGKIYSYCRGGKRYYYCNKAGDIIKIKRKRLFTTREIITIKNIKNPYPSQILIEHQRVGLKIELEFLR